MFENRNALCIATGMEGPVGLVLLGDAWRQMPLNVNVRPLTAYLTFFHQGSLRAGSIPVPKVKPTKELAFNQEY